VKIGFYGHSAASWAKIPVQGNVSFIDIIIEKYNAELVNVGVPEGSEERVLFELKKTKEIDLAIIFHAGPGCIFLPSCKRDIWVGANPLNKAINIWKNKTNNQLAAEKAKDAIHYAEDAEELSALNAFFQKSNSGPLGSLTTVFPDIDTFINTMALQREYLYHPDLEMNRTNGALIQIDQYITAMKIPAIHVYNTQRIPPWFKFTSGIEAPDIQELVFNTRPPTVTGRQRLPSEAWLPNNISPEGQLLIADALIEKIDILVSSGFQPT
jgi:hypothetical protein